MKINWLTAIFLLIMIFLFVVYYKGFTSNVGAIGTSGTGIIKQLQGGGANYPTGG